MTPVTVCVYTGLKVNEAHMHTKSAELNMSVIEKRAKCFTDARRQALGFDKYPDPLPTSIDEAYAIQDKAISLWGDVLTGWKVGRITGDNEAKFGTDRLAGPVFSRVVHKRAEGRTDMPVFENGFAAIEGEVTAVIACDADPDKLEYSTEDALSMIGALHMGVEVASSPFSGINDFGPLVTISDFGNNYGLILGDEIPNWKDFDFDGWEFATRVNNKEVGRATPVGLPGGPVESVRFLLENTAKRGLPLEAGMLILTGAITGVHEANIGDTAEVSFTGLASVSCKLTAETSAG